VTYSHKGYLLSKDFCLSKFIFPSTFEVVVVAPLPTKGAREDPDETGIGGTLPMGKFFPFFCLFPTTFD